jgi:hypothetical protein
MGNWWRAHWGAWVGHLCAVLLATSAVVLCGTILLVSFKLASWVLALAD